MPLSPTITAIRDLWRALTPDLRAEVITLMAAVPGTVMLGTLISAALHGA